MGASPHRKGQELVALFHSQETPLSGRNRSRWRLGLVEIEARRVLPPRLLYLHQYLLGQTG
jgi:hypothetical protein